MSGFSPEWLALRAPFDDAARSRARAAEFLAAVPAGGTIVDLGAGAGANAAWLGGLDPARRRWRLVDSDAGLLAHARARLGAGVETRVADLAVDLGAALGGAAGVTASALLDLVSAAWLARLADELARRRLPALFALSFDGRLRWTPADAADAAVALAFRLDMRRDKGFGPALGAAAADAAVDALVARGARLARAASDWTIGPGEAAMLDAMVDGVANAAIAAAPRDAALVAGWAARRRAQRRAGTLALAVSHQDLGARWA